MVSSPYQKILRCVALNLVCPLAVSCGFLSPVLADVVVLANRTREPVAVRILPNHEAPHGKTHARKPRKQEAPESKANEIRSLTIPSGRQVVVPVRGSCQLLYDVSGELARYQLAANSVYFFALDDGGWLDLSRVDLGGDLPAEKQPPNRSPVGLRSWGTGAVPVGPPG